MILYQVLSYTCKLIYKKWGDFEKQVDKLG